MKAAVKSFCHALSCFVGHPVSPVLREDAMAEYLTVAQDLETYGITYFQVGNIRFLVGYQDISR